MSKPIPIKDIRLGDLSYSGTHTFNNGDSCCSICNKPLQGTVGHRWAQYGDPDLQSFPMFSCDGCRMMVDEMIARGHRNSNV